MLPEGWLRGSAVCARLPDLRLRACVGLRARADGAGLPAPLARVVRSGARGLSAGSAFARLANFRDGAGDRLAEGARLIDGDARVVDRAHRRDAAPRAAVARLPSLGDGALLAGRGPGECKEREGKGKRAGSRCEGLTRHG